MNTTEQFERLQMLYRDVFTDKLKKDLLFFIAINEQQRMMKTLEDMVAQGMLIVPDYTVYEMTAKDDMRRSINSYPNKLTGWQYKGSYDANGKPLGAPKWVAERVKVHLESGVAEFKSYGSSIPKILHLGDWVVRRPDHPQLGPYRLSAEEVYRWYSH